MSSDPLGKTPPKQHDSREMPAIIANLLDLKDGVPDNKISKQEWNIFADYAGLEGTNEDFVSVEDAMVGVDVLLKNNPEKIVNYSREYLGQKYKIHREEDLVLNAKNQEREQKIYKNLNTAMNAFIAGMIIIKPTLGISLALAKNSKTISDAVIKRYINNSSEEDVRKTIKSLTEATSDYFPVSAELFNISVTPSDLKQGKHQDYTVLSPEQSEEKLAQIGMHANDMNEYGDPVAHFTSDKMDLKTVVFDKKSKVTEMVNKSSLIDVAIKYWEAEGSPKKKYYSGAMNDKMDELMSLNSCLVTITSVQETDKGKTYSGYVEDVYDFEENYEPESYSPKSKAVDSINKIGYYAQEKGALTNYRILIPFTKTVQK